MYRLEKAENKPSASNLVKAVWAAVGLGFFNIAIVLGPFIALVCLILAGWIIGLSFIASPLLVLVNLVVAPDTFAFFYLFASIGCAGLGLLISIGMTAISRMTGKGFLGYLRYHVKLVKGGLMDE